MKKYVFHTENEEKYMLKMSMNILKNSSIYIFHMFLLKICDFCSKGFPRNLLGLKVGALQARGPRKAAAASFCLRRSLFFQTVVKKAFLAVFKALLRPFFKPF